MALLTDLGSVERPDDVDGRVLPDVRRLLRLLLLLLLLLGELDVGAGDLLELADAAAALADDAADLRRGHGQLHGQPDIIAGAAPEGGMYSL